MNFQHILVKKKVKTNIVVQQIKPLPTIPASHESQFKCWLFQLTCLAKQQQMTQMLGLSHSHGDPDRAPGSDLALAMAAI